MKRYFTFLTVGLTVFFLFFQPNLNGQSFEASRNTSDAYIFLEWNIPGDCLNWDSGSPVYLQITDSLTQEVICSELITFPAGISDSIQGSYFYYVGPDVETTCRLELFEYGPGEPICGTPLYDTGQTLPFQAPLLSASDSLYPDKVVLTISIDSLSSLDTFSYLASYFLIYRDGQLIATLDSLQLIDPIIVVDSFLFNDDRSLVNGETYTYKVKIQSLRFPNFEEEVTEEGSTWPIWLEASDNVYESKVRLSWRTLDAIQDQIDALKILRDGTVLASLSTNETTYTDPMPTYGKAHAYELVLVNGAEDLVAISDIGGVHPNGLISGRITTKVGDYGLPGAKVYLDASIEGQNSLDSTYSDETGYYQFDSVYYAESAEFKLTVVFPGQIFSNNPRTIELSRERPEAIDINFQASKGYVLEDDALPTMDELTLTADTLQNAVQLDWTYRKPAGDTVFVQVIRDGQLLALWMDAEASAQVDTSFLDITGKPNSNPRYTVRVYSFIGTDTLTVSSLNKNIAYPDVYPVTSLTALPDEEIGVVELSWYYLATHISGFKVYRDGSLLITLPPSTMTYTDRGGIPVINQDHVYTVTAFTERNRVAYESPKVQETATYPYLPKPQNLAVEQVSEQDHILITWEQSVLDHSDYNFDGYLVFRKKEGVVKELARIDKGYPKAFKDLTGVPGTGYTYGVASYAANRLGAQWTSNTIFRSRVYPLVTPPHSFTAAVDSATRSVQLEWQHASDYADGFYLYKAPNTDPIAVLPGNARSYSDYLDNAPEDATYYLEAFVIRAGEAYASEPKNAYVFIDGLAVGDLSLPTKFKASTTYPDRVQLSWEYLPYLLPEFKLYRDGSLLATMDAFQRSYADTTAKAGVSYTYALEAELGDRLSAKVYGKGTVRSLKRLTGRVATANGAYGASGAFIQVIDSIKNEVYDFTTTDAAGYFRFEDLPFEDSIVYWVRAEAINHELQDSVLSVTLIEAEDNYEVHFISEKMWPAAPEDEVAEPIGVAVLTDDLNTTATVHWSVNSANYSGFEVYRSLDLLGTVGNGGPLSWMDVDGVPAIDYSYRVRAYWDREDGRRVFSAYASQPATFPALAPVENLKALPNLDYDRVELSWSHPTDRVDHYLIVREGESTLTAMVPAGTPMSYQDTMGLPGQIYRYSVYAVKEVDGDAVHSIPMVIRNVSYPGVAPVKNLQVQTLVNGIQLDWARTDEDIEGYYVYRDDEPIADLPGGTYTYQDYGGVPESTHVYAVAAYYTAPDGEIYTSDLRRVERTYPRLTAPDNLVLQDSAGGKLLKWIYPYVNGYNGFELFLARDTIEWVVVSDKNLSFYDDGGLPGGFYDYGIRVFKKVAGERVYSGLVNPMNSIYPSLPAPYSLMASDGDYYGYVQLEWNYESDLNDGFVVFRDDVAIDTIEEKGVRKYLDIFNDLPEWETRRYQYFIKAYKYKNEQFFNSKESNKNTGWARHNVATNHFSYEGYDQYKNNIGISSQGWAGVVAKDEGIDIYSKNEKGVWKLSDKLDDEIVVGKIIDNEWWYLVYLYTDITIAKYQAFLVASFWGIPRVDDYGILQQKEEGSWTKPILEQDENYSIIYKSDVNSLGEFILRRRNRTNDGNTGNLEHVDIIYSLDGNKKIFYFFSGGWGAGTAKADTRFMGTAIDNGLAAALFADADEYEIKTAYKDGKTWRGSDELYPPEGHSDYFGRALSINGNYLAVGDEAVGKGKVYYQQFDPIDKKWEKAWSDLTCEDPLADDFGWSIAMQDNLLAVGAPATDEGKGAVYLFKRGGEQWQQIRKITDNNPKPGQKFGLAIDIGGDNLVVAAQETVTFFDLDQPNAPETVSAGDGEHSGYVSISWIYHLNEDLTANGFRIYRNTLSNNFPELIGEVGRNTSRFSDTDVVPGRRYVYSVAAVGETGEESLRIADIGWSKANGTINGQVVSQSSFSGVPGITVTATGMVDGERHRRSMVTGPSGEFSFQNLPYGDSTTYEVKAFASGHAFVEDVKLAELTSDQSRAELGFFIDKTANILKGQLHPIDSECGIDSVDVTLTTFRGGSEDGFPETVKTNEMGEFSFIIDKFQADLDSMKLHISSYSVYGDLSNQDSVFHHFEWTDTTFIKDSILKFDNPEVLNVADMQTYFVPIQVVNACGDPLGNWEYQVEIKAQDGCFRQIYWTKDQGLLSVKLPSMNFLINVKAVSPVVQANIPVLEYLKYRPENLDLYSLHRSGKLLTDTVAVDVVYHRKPLISIASGLNRYLCDNLELPAILQQNDSVIIQFAVDERAGNQLCGVNEGFLLINNPASVNKKPDTILLDSLSEDFLPYGFRVGDPEIIAPFIHYMVVEYHTESDGYLAEFIQPIIVEGNKPLPGSDVIVSLDTSENGQIQLPLFILRDPPGDDSYSYIKKDSTFEKVLTISKAQEGRAGPSANFKVGGAIAGWASQLTVQGGGGDGESRTFRLSTKISEEIRTSALSTISQDGEYIIAENADVIVGLGLASQYGLAINVRVRDDCTVEKATALALTGLSVETDWIYNVNHIKNILIKGYERQLKEIENNQLVIEGMTKDQAIVYLGNLIKNWNAILTYHRKETLPHYNLCDPKTVDDLISPPRFGLKKSEAIEFKERLREWQEKCFCNEIGTYEADSLQKDTIFSLNKDIQWDQNLINKYNKLQQLFRDIENGRLTYENFPHWNSGAINSIKIDAAYQATYGPDAENITFSGNTIYGKEISVSGATASEFTNSAIAFVEGFQGAYIIYNIDVSKGLGVAIANTVFSSENQVGGAFSYNFKLERLKGTAQNTTQTVGYYLGDDEDGDQYSVTVIRGIDPSHTPYFDLLGGRSSCPPYEGTILREKPKLSFEWPNGTGVNHKQYDVPADGAATFPLALKNENPFNEPRWFYIFLDPSTNPYGARIYLDGRLMTEELYQVPANEPLYTTLQVERGVGNFYEFDSLGVIIRSYCSDVRANTALDRDTIYFSVFFDHPCSDVSITEPGNNWVVKRRNPLEPEAREQLLLRIADYDLANEQLDSLRVQYRRVGTAASGLDVGWVTETILTRDSLINYYEEFRLVYSQPQYLYAWDITDRPEILDGDYEIRVVADCGPQGVIISNVIRGRVDRSLVELLGFPQPDDGFLHRKEHIKVAFTEKLDCGAKELFAIRLRDQETGQDVPFTCLCYDNYLELRVADSTRNTFDGQILTARIDTVYDIVGNTLLDPIVWSFQVVQSPLYWSPNELEFDIYQGETKEFTAQLYNTGGATDFRLTYSMDSLELLTDNLTIYPSVEVGAKNVAFRLNTESLDIGSYLLKVLVQKDPPDVQGDFYSPYLYIKINVLGKPPFWQPDPTLYEHQMIVLANYQFTDALPSTDTTDVISAWIGNEIHGVGNIEKSGDHYVAYLFVYGDEEGDLEKPLEFRVWNAKEGKEYDAHPADSIFFKAGKTVGSSLAPKILQVNRLSDEARYIPLNGGGWTWFSLNTDQQGNPLNPVLRSLKATDGDIIHTKNSSASYLAETDEWITLDTLDYLSVQDGFAIWLQGEDDTLRVTGSDADVNYLPLDEGWHFIGYPPQEAKVLDESFFTDLPGSANIYVTRSALDNNEDDFAEYSSSAGWLKDFDIQPNRAYQLYVSDPTTWTFGEGTKAKPMGLVREKSGPVQTPQPQQAGTWTVNPADYANTMIVIADLLIDGEMSRDSLDRVAAFVGEECRGVAELEYIKALDQYQLSLFIYSNEPNEEVSIYLYDASRKEVYLHEEQLNYQNNAIIGKMSDPYHLVNLPKPKARLVAEDLYCREDPGGRITIAEFVSGTAPFEVQWSTGSTDMQLNGLAAGTYVLTITDASGQALQDSVTIREFDLSAMQPKVSLAEEGVICVGESAFLMADSLVPSATFSWYDEKENLIGEDAVLLLTNLQKDRRVYLEADIHGCRSDRGIVEIRVQQPDASFEILAEPMAQAGDTIRFSPVIGEQADHLYRWSFGDGSTSEEVRPIHIYTQAGTYDVSLEVTDESGCTNEVTHRGFLQIGSATGTDQWPVWLSEWTVAPNPFHQILHVNFVIHRADAYWISLKDQWGREISRQKMDLNAGKHSILLDVAASLPDGSYYVEIKNEAGERGLYKVVRQ